MPFHPNKQFLLRSLLPTRNRKSSSYISCFAFINTLRKFTPANLYKKEENHLLPIWKGSKSETYPSTSKLIRVDSYSLPAYCIGSPSRIHPPRSPAVFYHSYAVLGSRTHFESWPHYYPNDASLWSAVVRLDSPLHRTLHWACWRRDSCTGSTCTSP